MIHGKRGVYTWRIRELFPEKFAGQTLKKRKQCVHVNDGSTFCELTGLSSY